MKRWGALIPSPSPPLPCHSLTLGSLRDGRGDGTKGDELITREASARPFGCTLCTLALLLIRSVHVGTPCRHWPPPAYGAFGHMERIA